MQKKQEHQPPSTCNDEVQEKGEAHAQHEDEQNTYELVDLKQSEDQGSTQRSRTSPTHRYQETIGDPSHGIAMKFSTNEAYGMTTAKILPPESQRPSEATYEMIPQERTTNPCSQSTAQLSYPEATVTYMNCTTWLHPAKNVQTEA